jgi:hypothetical protein
MKAQTKFEKLMREGIILSPESFSEDDKKQIESLTDDEVKALVNIRAKLGDEFLKKKSGGKQPGICIVF